MQAPFDGRFKILAEEYPDLLLRLLGILEPGTKCEVVHILRELQLDPVAVDHVYRIGDESDGRLVHFEAITHWSSQRTSRLALYRFLLKHKYRLPVASYVVLMAEKYAPKALPARVEYREPDGFLIAAPYQVIKLWEIDPGLAFQPGGQPLLPWVPLLKGGQAELDRLAAGMAELMEHPETAPYPVSVMVNNLATLAGLRYDKDVIRQLIKRLGTKMMLDTELFVDTWLYKDGVKAGKVEGKAEGKVEGEREAVRTLLSARFPSLLPMPELDRIASTQALKQVLLAVADAKTEDDVHIAVEAALCVN
jgi:hypothetical protein